MRKQINLKEITFTNVAGEKFKQEEMIKAWQGLADFLYTKADSIEMVEITMSMHKIQMIEINEQQKDKIISLSKEYFAFVYHYEFEKYLKSIFSK